MRRERSFVVRRTAKRKSPVQLGAGKKAKRIPDKGIREAKSVIGNTLGALLRGQPQEIALIGLGQTTHSTGGYNFAENAKGNRPLWACGLSKKVSDKLVVGGAGFPATTTPARFCLNPADSGQGICKEAIFSKNPLRGRHARRRPRL